MDNTIYDCIIIGAGPAGLTSAIYLLRAGKNVLILEKSTIGGGIASTPMIENYPGCARVSGEQLADNLFAQVTDFGGNLEVWEVKKIEEDGDHYKLVTDGPDFFAKTIIIATGTTWRRLGLPNEENLIGHGISFCVTCDGAFYKDQTVAIIGGGNTAVTNALELSEICKKLIVVQNLADLTGENILNEKLKAKENVEIIYNATVKELIGEDELKGIVINTPDGEKKIDVDGMFISIGLVPQTDFVKDSITLNKFNYIDAVENCNTNLKGVFVAGDVRNKAYHQITTATSDGTVAALEVQKYLDK
jgi:thioredoxin reductase (NADPH)